MSDAIYNANDILFHFPCKLKIKKKKNMMK